MDQIFDNEKFKQEYENYSEELLSEFEKFINEKMEKLFEGVMNQNWPMIYKVNHGLIGLGVYSCTNRLLKLTKSIQRFFSKHRKPSIDGVSVSFEESFDEEAKLQAMDFCRSIFEEARLLRLEISKYTKTVVPQDIYLKEIEQIKLLYENMLKEYQMNQTKYQTINSGITQLDKPENASCTEKCIIF